MSILATLSISASGEVCMRADQHIWHMADNRRIIIMLTRAWRSNFSISVNPYWLLVCGECGGARERKVMKSRKEIRGRWRGRGRYAIRLTSGGDGKKISRLTGRPATAWCDDGQKNCFLRHL